MGPIGTTVRIVTAMWTTIVTIGAFSATAYHFAPGPGTWFEAATLGLLVGLLGSIMETWAGYYLRPVARWLWWMVVAVITFEVARYVVPGLSLEGVFLVAVTVSWVESLIGTVLTVQ